MNRLDRLYRFDRDVLEAVDRVGELMRCELPSESGWCRRSSDAAIYKLYHTGLAYKACNKYRLTERGKILLAIVRGKERRAKMQTRRIAA